MSPKNGKVPNVRVTRTLTQRQRTFVACYIKTHNATQAYFDAGYSATTRQIASVDSSRLLRNPLVQEEIDQQLNAVFDKMTTAKAIVMQTWMDVMLTDMREFCEIRRAACRHCYGVDHSYQWRVPSEFEDECAKYASLTERQQAMRKPPNDAGGYGFRRIHLPFENCPRCDGDGETYVIFHDSRGYSRSAATSYNGVTVSANGNKKIFTLSRIRAAELLAQALGMFSPGYLASRRGRSE